MNYRYARMNRSTFFLESRSQVTVSVAKASMLISALCGYKADDSVWISTPVEEK